jgi:putative mRNA 3-end processing factor
MRMDPIVTTSRGLYCPAGDFYIDPWKPVERAVITHGHGDHARPGCGAYLCHTDSMGILARRLGDPTLQGLSYAEPLLIGDAKVSLHPAGNILGSAQVRVEHRGEVWVVSGDYKIEPDSTCAPFEPLRCDAFITECTFGLPIYRWRSQQETIDEIEAWRRDNAAERRASVLFAYELGKAQRLLHLLNCDSGPVVCHGAVESINEIYRAAGVPLPQPLAASDLGKADFATALILAPPSAAGSRWLDRFGAYSDAFVSGWMRIRGNRRRRGVDRGFALSDHADWPGLLWAVSQTNAARVLATHGFADAFARHLRDIGVAAETLSTEYGDEAEEDVACGEAATA